MSDGGNLILADGVVDDIKAVRALLSREGLNHFDAHVREWAGFAHRDKVTKEYELSLRKAISPVENRGYRVDRVHGVDYYSLTYGHVGSLVAYFGDAFVVLWFGRSTLTAAEGAKAKKTAARRLKQAREKTKEI